MVLDRSNTSAGVGAAGNEILLGGVAVPDIVSLNVEDA